MSSVKPWIIGDDLANLVVKKGQVIKYDIKYGGEPEPTATWKINGKEIKADGDRYVLRSCLFVNYVLPTFQSSIFFSLQNYYR